MMNGLILFKNARITSNRGEREAKEALLHCQGVQLKSFRTVFNCHRTTDSSLKHTVRIIAANSK